MAYAFNDDKSKVELLDFFYPVGSIYETADNDFVPDEVWGGTWEKVQGRFLLGSSDSYDGGSTGGSADAVNVSHSHTASTDSKGSHNHNILQMNGNTGYAGSAGTNMFYRNVSGTKTTEGAGAHTHTVTVNSSGVSGTGKNMPPYLVVNIWKRVS